MLHLLSFSVAPLLVTLLMGCFLRPEKALNFGVALAFWATTPAALPKTGWDGWVPWEASLRETESLCFGVFGKYRG